MATATFGSLFVCVTLLVGTFTSVRGQLDPCFYDEVCPKALPTIKMIVEQAIEQEPRMGASLLRLHFHDCFVNVNSPNHN